MSIVRTTRAHATTASEGGERRHESLLRAFTGKRVADDRAGIGPE